MEIVSENRVYRRIVPVTIILMLCFGLIYSGSGGGITANTCTTINNLCNDQISFHASAIGNSTAGSNLLTSTSWTAIQNETMVVLMTSLSGDTVTSITDSASDSFTRRYHATQLCLPCMVFDIWTGRFAGSTGQSNSVTMQFNNASDSSQELFFVGTYLNVKALGNTNGTSGNAPSGSFLITTSQSGSWIVGGMFGTGQAGNSTCPGETPGPGLIKRVSGCGIQESPGIGINGDLKDNATALPNNHIFSFADSWDNNGGAGVGFMMGGIELLPVDREPNSPNFNNFCTTTNGLCVTSPYALNYAGTSTRPNSGTVALASGTAYCTGITTAALTTTGTHTIQVWVNYGGFNRNVTSVLGGPSFLIQVYISTTAPSTTFGAGLCSASGNGQVATGTLEFPTSGGIVAANAYSMGINGVGPASAANTWYGFIEVTPLNFPVGTGHMQYNQAPASVNALCWITMLEIK
jgi:hypothetical protein